jgi:hypothetical protein
VPTDNQLFTSVSAAGLSAEYKPQAGSDLIGAGTHVRYSTDAAGKVRANPPTVGAFEP